MPDLRILHFWASHFIQFSCAVRCALSGFRLFAQFFPFSFRASRVCSESRAKQVRMSADRPFPCLLANAACTCPRLLISDGCVLWRCPRVVYTKDARSEWKCSASVGKLGNVVKICVVLVMRIHQTRLGDLARKNCANFSPL